MDIFPRYSKPKYSKGQMQILRERFQLSQDKPLPEDGKVAQMSYLLNLLLKKIKNSDAVKADSLNNKWSQLVGEVFAAKTRPGYIARDVLTIFVSDTVWLQEIRLCMDKNKLLEKIKTLSGCSKIKSIRFELDPRGNARK